MPPRSSGGGAMPAGSRRRTFHWAFAALVSLAVAASCGGQRRDRTLPLATLSTTAGAANELAEIESLWRTPGAEGRVNLRARLERFIERFPDDGATPLARVYLAFVYLDAGDLQRAEIELAALQNQPRGATNDFAQVARAEALRVRGRPADALAFLSPLAGKMVDREARERFDQAIVRAALDAHRDFEALAYMDAWLRNTDEHERDSVRERVAGAIAKMSPSVLVPALTTMRRRDSASGYGKDLQRLVTARVAEIAVEQDDPKLAQWLVDADAGAVLSDEAELLVSELATRQAGGTAFIGRTVGLVLPTGSSALRDAAGDVARGMAWALEIPRTRPGAGDDTRLITRDDSGKRGQLEAELEELAAEGAGIIVAGLDTDSAERAVRWSEGSGIPVLTLAAPVKARARSSAFILGERRDVVLAALADALAARRETRVAVVADRDNLSEVATVLATRKPKLEVFQPAACEIEDKQGGESRFPTETWEAAKFRTWLVAGPESCARDLMREVGELNGALLAFSLEATGRVERGLAAHVLTAAAGIIPVAEPEADRASRTRAVGRRAPGSDPRSRADETKSPSPKPSRGDGGTTHEASESDAGTNADDSPSGENDESTSSEVARYVQLLGGVPTWRAALGRDAGALARRALRSVATDTAKDASEVGRRRDRVRSALESANLRLWTTEARSFDRSTHMLPRTVRVVELH